MKPSHLLLFLIVFLGCLPASVQAGDAESVALARALLGPQHWSQAIVIRNPKRAGALPSRVHAAVFAFDGVLWLYVPREGTQSLSHRRGRLELDRANLLPLLHEINPEFTGYEVDPAPPPGVAVGDPPKLRNGCFVESLHALARLRSAGVEVRESGLLTSYVQGPKGLLGHTGLLYRTPEGVFFWDPDRPARPRRITAGGDQPDQVAQKVRPQARWHVVRTHFLPIDGDLRRPGWGRPVVQVERDGASEPGTT